MNANKRLELIETLKHEIECCRLSLVFRQLAQEIHGDRMILLRSGDTDAMKYLSQEQIILEETAKLFEEAERNYSSSKEA